MYKWNQDFKQSSIFLNKKIEKNKKCYKNLVALCALPFIIVDVAVLRSNYHTAVISEKFLFNSK